MSARPHRILIVGNPGAEHIGAHLLAAARWLGFEAELVDHRRAWGTSRLLNALSYRLARRHPTRLHAFSAEVLDAAARFRPTVAIVTGISAPDAPTIRALRSLGVRVVSFLTDDPWNPRNAAGFFRAALREYDAVLSPRRANLTDLERHGCRGVAYLPFAYNPEIHYPEPPASREEHARFDCDVAIVGGADEDRVPLATALARAGFRLRLFGGYWDRWPETRAFHGGFVLGRELRMAVAGATVNVCMVRRANRDGHSMRSLEIPAMGGSLVAEDTSEHRELYGDASTAYYATPAELVAQAKSLCADPPLARAAAARLSRRIREESAHTYTDRLRWIVERFGT
jgi:spore maturation protein CgeB